MENRISRDIGVMILKLILYAVFTLLFIKKDVSSLSKKVNFKILKRGTS
jgi:hypothetical protein